MEEESGHTKKQIKHIQKFFQRKIFFFSIKDFKIFKINKQDLDSQDFQKKTEIRAYTFTNNNFNNLDGIFRNIELSKKNYILHNLNTEYDIIKEVLLLITVIRVLLEFIWVKMID